MSEPIEILQLAAEQQGLVAVAQLRERAVSRSAVDWLTRSGDWEHVTDAVLRRSGSPATVAQELMAVVLDVGGDASIGYFTGANWWGLGGCPLRPVRVVTTRRSRRRSGLGSTRVVRSLPERWSTRLRGVPVVRPELLALQLFSDCRSDARADRLVDRLWSMRLLSGPSVAAFVDEMGASGRNGTAGLRRYLAERGAGYVPPASGLESRAMEIFDSIGLPMRRQVDSGGETWTGRVDFRHERLPLVVEVQSDAFHAALADRRHDADRRTRLECQGFAVVEVTDSEVFGSPAVVVARVRSAIRKLNRF